MCACVRKARVYMYRCPMYFDIDNLAMSMYPYHVYIIINFPIFFQILAESCFIRHQFDHFKKPLLQLHILKDKHSYDKKIKHHYV